MVERCSNGAPFTILAPQPAVRTGIRVEIYDKDDPSTQVAVLPDTRNRKWVDPLNETGAGEFEIHEDDPKLAETPNVLQPGNFIRFYIDNIPRFTARIERRKYTPVSSDEDSGRWIRVSGRGALAQLEDGAIYPAGALTGAADRDVTGLTPGAAFLDFYAEAAARGSIVNVFNTDFTDTLDTNNQPYNFTLDETVRAGRDDLLTIIQRWAEMGVDVRVTPLLALQLFANGKGVDKTIQTADTAPVIFRRAHNVTDLEVDQDLIIKNTFLVETPAGFFERAEPASATTHGRREGFLSLGNTTSGDYIDRATTAAFAKLADIRTAITAEVLDVDGHRPYVDGDVGDWIFAPNETGALERFRILGMTVTEDEDGNPIFVPTLNEETAELEARLQKWLRTMTPGTLGGEVSETTAPNTTTTAESNATATAEAEAAVDTHESGFPHHDEFSDLADVDLTGLQDGQLVRYDAGIPAWVPLDIKIDLTTPPDDDDILKYDNDTDTWKPAPDVGGGSGGSGPPAGTYTERVAALGPLFHWLLDEASGTTASDERGLLTGTYVGTPTLGAAGIDPEGTVCPDFDGTNDGVTIAWTAESPEGQTTFAAWIEPDDVTTKRTIFEVGGSTDGFHLHLRGGELHAVVIKAGTAYSVSTSVSVDTVYHVAAVWRSRGVTVDLYLDGVYIGSAGPADPTTSVTGTDTGAIGIPSALDGTGIRFDNGDTSGSSFDGKISNAAFWQRGLTDWELAYLAG